jgi:hypothetical protein
LAQQRIAPHFPIAEMGIAMRIKEKPRPYRDNRRRLPVRHDC